MGSEIPGLYKMDQKARKKAVMEAASLDEADMAGFDPGTASMKVLDGMIENVIGSFSLPIGVATNFRINSRDVLVPMATEEPSVVAAASKAAKIALARGGFKASSHQQVMIGQVQMLDVPDPSRAAKAILSSEREVLELAITKDAVLVKNRGGAKGLTVRVIGSSAGTMLIIHLLVDCRDAMGANAVNTMTEAVAPMLEHLTGGRALLRVISNLAVERISSASAVFPAEELGGPRGVKAITEAQAFADADIFRAATHNKGIMNGVSAVVRATGNDTRAAEAAAHSYAAISGHYSPLTSYRVGKDGDLVGTIVLPTPAGTMGGATNVHPAAKASLKLLGVRSASELGEVLASVGLAQNLAALRALSGEGIQKGHMRLHARNLALQAGAAPEEVDEVVKGLQAGITVSASRASEILENMRRKSA